jgi:hypothetical protein
MARREFIDIPIDDYAEPPESACDIDAVLFRAWRQRKN